MNLKLSRSGLDDVHNYVRYWIGKGMEVPKFPNPRTIRDRMATACDRRTHGDDRRAVFVIPAGTPGVKAGEVVFEVIFFFYMLLRCSYLIFCFLVDRYFDTCICAIPGPQNCGSKQFYLAI